MIITSVNTGEKAPYSVNGTNVTVGDVTIDLSNRQGDTERVIDVCLDNQLETMREGLGAWYVATIIIPPVRYDLVPVEEEGTDEESDSMKEVARPLDMSRVELRLWRLPAEYNSNGSEEVTENEDEVSE